MPRTKSPCGTYPAYKRHLREKTTIDPACRRAQQEHDAVEGQSARSTDLQSREPARIAPDPLVAAYEDARARYATRLVALVAAVREDHDMKTVVDVASEADDLLDEWCAAADACAGLPRGGDGK